jgi:hypothetical protein
MSLTSATMMLLQKRGDPGLLLPEVLKEIYVGQRTGMLHVTRDEEARVSFRSVNGELVSGFSSAERGRLGESLVRRGLVSRIDLERALVIVNREGRRLAPVLRELDLVDTPGLEQALALHIREMLLTALLWDETWLLFEDQELPDAPAEDLTLRCSTAELIMELVRRIPGPETVRRGLGNVDRPLALVPDSRVGRDLIVHPADVYVVSRADGCVSARGLIEKTSLPVAAVERSLLGLLFTGVVRYVSSSVPSAPATGATSHSRAS